MWCTSHCVDIAMTHFDLLIIHAMAQLFGDNILVTRAVCLVTRVTIIDACSTTMCHATIV